MMKETSAPPIGLGADLAGADAEQRRVVDLIKSGPRGNVPKPFLAMLDAPGLAEAIQSVGATIRYGSTLPDDLRELAILTAAARADCGYEWNHHLPIGKAAGLEPAAIAAARGGAAGKAPRAQQAAVISLCLEAFAGGKASSGTLAAAIDELGRTGATEVVAIAGYYPLLAGFIRTAGFDENFEPLPDG